LEFHIDLTTKNVTLLKNVSDPHDPQYAGSQGDYEALPNGNVLLGYGQLPVFKEFGPRGDVRLPTHWSVPNVSSSSYRSFRLDWQALPAAAPIVVAEAGSAFFSWNGATDITAWQVYKGLTASTLKLTKTVANAGFETEASISTGTKFVKVGALGCFGLDVLRKSSVVPVTYIENICKNKLVLNVGIYNVIPPEILLFPIIRLTWPTPPLLRLGLGLLKSVQVLLRNATRNRQPLTRAPRGGFPLLSQSSAPPPTFDAK